MNSLDSNLKDIYDLSKHRLYHYTKFSNLKSILEKGLIPRHNTNVLGASGDGRTKGTEDISNNIYITTSPDFWCEVDIRYNNCPGVVPNIAKLELDIDMTNLVWKLDPEYSWGKSDPTKENCEYILEEFPFLAVTTINSISSSSIKEVSAGNIESLEKFWKYNGTKSLRNRSKELYDQEVINHFEFIESLKQKVILV